MCSKSSLPELPKVVGAFILLNPGETRLGETTLFKVLLRGELRTWLFREGVGDPIIAAEDRTEVFFLMDRGSMGVAVAELERWMGLGVASVLPVG